MYVNGMELRAIKRVKGVNHNTVIRWVGNSAIALCWAVKREWLHQHQPIKVKKHDRKATKAIRFAACSIFRHALDHLRSIVTDLDLKYLDLKYNEFLHSLKFLSTYSNFSNKAANTVLEKRNPSGSLKRNFSDKFSIE